VAESMLPEYEEELDQVVNAFVYKHGKPLGVGKIVRIVDKGNFSKYVYPVVEVKWLNGTTTNEKILQLHSFVPQKTIRRNWKRTQRTWKRRRKRCSDSQ